MHKVTIFPLANADCTRLDLTNGRKVLIDYADTRDPHDQYDLRCDLPRELREDLDEAGRDYYDVVAFSHLDSDHYRGASEFFWLEHAAKYQDDDRIRINTIWVPAAVITETGVDDDEGRVIQREAQYRFKMGDGIRVFSRPERLRDWCDDHGIDLDDRLHLITDAGQLAPEFSLDKDNVEFFVHSPFAKRLNATKVENRNDDSLVLQVTFVVEGVHTKMLLMADVTHGTIDDIVEVTRDIKKRPERLESDIVKIPHHCSYRSLGPERGISHTEPTENVAWLYESQAQSGIILVSTSKPIPSEGSDEDKDNNPPHRQAATYYKHIADMHDGQFVVTMEHPRKAAPRPVIIEIDGTKATLLKRAATATVAATTRSAPRAG